VIFDVKSTLKTAVSRAETSEEIDHNSDLLQLNQFELSKSTTELDQSDQAFLHPPSTPLSVANAMPEGVECATVKSQ
jgi:hypothetical protein